MASRKKAPAPAKRDKRISVFRSIWAKRASGVFNITFLLGRIVRIKLHESKRTKGKMAEVKLVSKAVLSGKWIDYHNTIAFGGLAQWMFDFLKPGMTVLVVGQVEIRHWKTPTGMRARPQIVIRQIFLAPAWSKFRSYGQALADTEIELDNSLEGILGISSGNEWQAIQEASADQGDETTTADADAINKAVLGLASSEGFGKPATGVEEQGQGDDLGSPPDPEPA